MGLFDRVKKIKSRDFMEAVSAASALVAYADGLSTPEEVSKLIEYIRLDETLKVFDAGEVIEAFERYVESFEFDLRIGKEKAMKAIRKLPPRTEEARLLILLCCAIGQADMEFDNNERLVIREICQKLGFHPNEFDLDLRAPRPSDIPKAPKTSPKTENIPDWMRDTSNLPKPSQSSSKREPKKKSEPIVEQADIPDWMRQPIEPYRRPKKESADVPGWMRNPPDIPNRIDGEKNRNKFGSGSSQGTEDRDAVPDWMRDPSKAFERLRKDGNIPDWMRKNKKT